MPGTHVLAKLQQLDSASFVSSCPPAMHCCFVLQLRTPEPASGAASSAAAAAAAAAVAAASATAASATDASEAADTAAPDVQRHRRTGEAGVAAQQLHIVECLQMLLMAFPAAAELPIAA